MAAGLVFDIEAAINVARGLLEQRPVDPTTLQDATRLTNGNIVAYSS
jgi:hypothetical protein